MPNSATYVKVGNVVATIARSNKNLVIDKYDVAEWCAEVLNDVGEIDDLVLVKDEPIKVSNFQIPLPCRLYRLIGIRRNNCALDSKDYTRNGPYIRFSKDGGFVHIDYAAIPVDEDGLPLIPSTHKQACFWYCLTRLYMEDFLNGKIPENRWREMDNKYQNYVTQARQSFVNKTANQLSELNMIRHNMIRTVRFPKSIP